MQKSQVPAALGTVIKYPYAYWGGEEGSTNVEFMALPVRMYRSHSEAHLDVLVGGVHIRIPSMGLEQHAVPARRDEVLVEGDGQVRRVHRSDAAVEVLILGGGAALRAVAVEPTDAVLDAFGTFGDLDLEDDVVFTAEVCTGLRGQPLHLGRAAGGTRVGESGLLVVPVLVVAENIIQLVTAAEHEGGAAGQGEQARTQGGHGTLRVENQAKCEVRGAYKSQ